MKKINKPHIKMIYDVANIKTSFFSKIKCVNGKGIFNCYLGFVDDIRQVHAESFFLSDKCNAYDCFFKYKDMIAWTHGARLFIKTNILIVAF